MAFLFGFMGALAGLVIAFAMDAEGLGFFLGALAGGLLGSWINLRDRLSRAEQRLHDLQLRVTSLAARAETVRVDLPASAPVAPAPAASPVQPPVPSPEPVRAAPPAVVETPEPAPIPVLAEAPRKPLPPLPQPPVDDRPDWQKVIDSPSEARVPLTAGGPARRSGPATPPPSRPATPAIAQDAWRWLIEGNWVAKVGIVLVLIALGAFFRFASAQGWLTFPIELRLAAVAAGAIGALVLGWRERHRRRLFALNLQGGAIAVLLLTVFAAYRMYQLLPGGMTFALLLGLVAACAFLAIRQDSRGLAVFGLIGGFAAPILASTGQGSHVALFSYYLLLNVGILAISWAKGWRVLNVLGFLFTFVIGTLWGVQRYVPEHFATTEPFLVAFFLFYLAIPLLPAIRGTDPDRRDRVDGSLVFGTPLAAFALQTALLVDDRDRLALSALVVAIIYAALAWFVWKHAQLARWRKAYAGLALVFSTLVIPLAFSAQTTAAFWAIEGAALVWLGIDQDQRRLRWVGLLLQLMAACALFIGGGVPADATLVLNRVAITGLVIAFAAVFSATVYQRRESGNVLSPLLVVWAALWWFGIGFHEIDRVVPGDHRTDIVLLFIAASALVFGLARRGLGVPSLAWPAQLVLGTAILWVIASTARHDAPFGGDGLYALGGHLLLGVLTLWTLRSPWARGLSWVHVGWWLALPLALMLQIDHAFDSRAELLAFGDGWRYAATGFPVLAAAALLLHRQDWIALPLHAMFPRYRERLQVPVMMLVMLGVALLAFDGGDASPLPFVPLFNPSELMQLFGMLLLWAWGRQLAVPEGARATWNLMLAFAAFFLVTLMTLRATHHFGNEDWSPGMLAHSLPNAALSIVWTVLGIVGMLLGAARRRRALWVAGAVVLGVVVAKLLLVDMRLLGTLPAIVSLLVVGILFVAVGYFAPMPPATARDADAPDDAASGGDAR